MASTTTRYAFNIHTTQFEVQTYPKGGDGYNLIVIDEFETNKLVEKTETLITLSGSAMEQDEVHGYPQFKFGDIDDVVLRGYCIQHINNTGDNDLLTVPILVLSVDGVDAGLTFNLSQSDASVAWEVTIPKASMPAGTHAYTLTSNNFSDVATAALTITIDRDPANILTPSILFPHNIFDGNTYSQTHLRSSNGAQKFAGTTGTDAIFEVSTDVTSEWLKISAVNATTPATETYVVQANLNNTSGNIWESANTNYELSLANVPASPGTFRIEMESNRRVVGESSVDGGSNWTSNGIDIDKIKTGLTDILYIDNAKPLITVDSFAAYTPNHEAIRYDSNGDHDRFTFNINNVEQGTWSLRPDRFKVESTGAETITWACDATGDHSGSDLVTLTAAMNSDTSTEHFNVNNLKVTPFNEHNGLTNNATSLKVPIDNTAILLLDPEILHSNGSTWVSLSAFKLLTEGTYTFRVRTDDKLKVAPVVTIKDQSEVFTQTATLTATTDNDISIGSEHRYSFTLDNTVPDQQNLNFTIEYVNISGWTATHTKQLGPILRLTDVTANLPTVSNPTLIATTVQQTQLKASDPFDVTATVTNSWTGFGQTDPTVTVSNGDTYFANATELTETANTSGIFNTGPFTTPVVMSGTPGLNDDETFSLSVTVIENDFGSSTTRTLDSVSAGGSVITYNNVYPVVSPDIPPWADPLGYNKESLGYHNGLESGAHLEWNINSTNQTHIKFEDPQSSNSYLAVDSPLTVDNNSHKNLFMEVNEGVEHNLVSTTEVQNMQATAFTDTNGATTIQAYYFPIDNTVPTMVVEVKLDGTSTYLTFVNGMQLPTGTHTLKITGDDKFIDGTTPTITANINSGGASTLSGYTEVTNEFANDGAYEFTVPLDLSGGMSTLTLDITSTNTSYMTTNSVLTAVGEFDSIAFGLPITNAFHTAGHQTTKARSLVDGSSHRTRFSSTSTTPAVEYGYIKVITDLSADVVGVQEKNQAGTRVLLDLVTTTANEKIWFVNTNTFEVRNTATTFYLTYDVHRTSGVTSSTDSGSQIVIDNTEPTLTSPAIDYPGSVQTSVADGQSVDIVFTNSNADSYICIPNTEQGWALSSSGNSTNPITGNITIGLDWNWGIGDM